MNRPLPSFLEPGGLALLLFGGKGGVGKTTCAASSALRLAGLAPARSILLVSIDPAHSLRDSLAGLTPPANLKILELDAQEYLGKFRAKNGQKLREIAAAGTFLDDEDIDRFLNLSLPGLDELMAFLEISGWLEDHRYDSIVVDTAPSGHTLRLLAMPGLIRKWLHMLDILLAKRRYMRKVFGKSAGRDQLDQFVDHWDASLRRTETLLRDPSRCRFVPVTIAEPLSVRETAALLAELRQWRIPAPDLVVNLLHPQNGCPTCSSARALEQRQVERLRTVFGGSPPSLWGVDLFTEEVRGRELLSAFWDHAAPIAPAPLTAPALHPVHRSGMVAANPPPYPPPGIQFLLFAGKGGVGKTTLACATAVKLARDSPEKRILLFSTDPAHSLSACLKVEIGPRPTELCPGLTALEIDAEAEFHALKAQYAKDVEGSLESIAGGFDLTFDRQVLEKMMDLAPPGLDEVMALTRIIDFLSHDRYDLILLDSAATGHLIRLLELPEVIDQWLKTFFSFFLKYERVLRMPGFSSQLVVLSKNLKRFRKLLGDPARAALYAVSIPTQMAVEETRDLLEACNRLGIAVPALFLNLVTLPGDCYLCSALERRESLAARDFRQLFRNKQMTLVYRQGELSGLDRLEELGRNLYQAASREEAVVYASR
jgi:arsenite-transporting ATPase